MRVFETVASMFGDLHKAKIVSLREWRDMRLATGWRPVSFSEFRAKLRGEDSSKKRMAANRRKNNKRVLREYNITKGKKP